jgi:hypothetical protein
LLRSSWLRRTYNRNSKRLLLITHKALNWKRCSGFILMRVRVILI